MDTKVKKLSFDRVNVNQENSEKTNNTISDQGPSIGEIVQLVFVSLSQVESFKKSKQSNDCFCDSDDVPSFTSILEWLDVKQGIKLDEEQQMAYEVICLSFLIKLLDGDEVNDYDGTSNVTSSNVTETLNKELRCLVKDA